MLGAALVFIILITTTYRISHRSNRRDGDFGDTGCGFNHGNGQGYQCATRQSYSEANN